MWSTYLTYFTTGGFNKESEWKIPQILPLVGMGFFEFWIPAVFKMFGFKAWWPLSNMLSSVSVCRLHLCFSGRDTQPSKLSLLFLKYLQTSLFLIILPGFEHKHPLSFFLRLLLVKLLVKYVERGEAIKLFWVTHLGPTVSPCSVAKHFPPGIPGDNSQVRAYGSITPLQTVPSVFFFFFFCAVLRYINIYHLESYFRYLESLRIMSWEGWRIMFFFLLGDSILYLCWITYHKHF